MAKLAPNQVSVSDLTDAQWALIAPLLPVKPGPGRPQTYPPRSIVNAMLYRLRTGCQWRLLPMDYPQWTAVRYHWDTWARAGLWERINTGPREQAREATGRAPTPAGGVLDSQSVKASEAADEVGFDGGEKGARAQAPHPGGHAGVVAGGDGDARRRA